MHFHGDVVYNSGREKEDGFKSIQKKRIRLGEGLSSQVSFELWRRVIIIRNSIDEKQTTYISLVTSIPVNTFQPEWQLKIEN